MPEEEVDRVPVRPGAVADREVADGAVADGEVADGAVADGEVAYGEVADGAVADRKVADGKVADRKGAHGQAEHGDAAHGDAAHGDAAQGDAAHDEATDARSRIHPERTLWLLSIAHAVNHAQAVLLPLVYLEILTEFHVTLADVATLAAVGAFASGIVQLSFAKLTRVVSRRVLLGSGGIVFGGGFAAMAAAPSFPSFATVNVLSRMGGAPQHPVGNGLLAEQFPEERRGFAISAHISGGNVGTVVVAVVGAALIKLLGWRWVVVLFGLPAVIVAIAILVLVRETGVDRQAALAHGSVRQAFGAVLRDPAHRWIYLASVLGGGGRGLGVVNLFALAYLTIVIGLPDATSNAMYGALIVLSVPMPLVAGWLSDRLGRRPVIIGVYIGGAIAFAAFLLAGHSLIGLWIGIFLMGLFTFAESPQLQALLADVADPRLRDTSFSLYFTLAFGVGSLWTFVYGQITQALGDTAGLPVVFVVMAASFILAALAVVPIRDDPVAARAAGRSLARRADEPPAD